jgi:hypothetical protein
MGKNIIFGGLAIIILIIGAIWFLGAQKPSEAPLPVNQPEVSPVVKNAPAENPLVFGNLGPGTYTRAVEPKKQATESLTLSGQGQAVLKITSRDPKIKVGLRDENHNLVTNSSVVKQTVIKESNGETTFIFQIKSGATSGTKDWQLIVSNPNLNTPVNYNLTVSETPQISASSNTSSGNNLNTGNANLSLILQETVALNVTVPVINASVVANITDPNNQTSTVALTENETTPGTYTGTFNNVDTPGLYQVAYVISGQNSEGQPFDQVVTDQFTVPDPSAGETPPPNPVYQSTKKFDINQANEIRPIY